jgi:hypothetical protein
MASNQSRTKKHIARTSKAINYAKKIGANVSEAEGLVEQSKALFDEGEFNDSSNLLKKADEQIKAAKHYRRSEMMIFNALPNIEKAEKVGADLTEARKSLETAKDMLDRGIYGKVSEFVKISKREADDAKKYKQTKETISQAVPILENAKRSGADVTGPAKLMLSAWDALRKRNYGIVENLIKQAIEKAKAAEEYKKMEDSILEVQAKVEQLKSQKIGTSKVENHINKAFKALKDENYSHLQKEVNAANIFIDKILIKKKSFLSIQAVEQFIAAAKDAGMEANDLQDLLSRASVAFDQERYEEIDTITMEAEGIVKNLRLLDKVGGADIVRKGMVHVDEGDLSISLLHDLEDFDQIITEAKKAGVETGELDNLFKMAKEAVQNSMLPQATDLITQIKTILSQREAEFFTYKSKTRFKDIGGTIREAREAGIDTTDAEDHLQKAIQSIGEQDAEQAAKMINEAEDIINQKIKEGTKGKTPKLSFSMEKVGYEEGTWNKVSMNVENKGNIAAKNIMLMLPENIEVKGLEKISKLDPGKVVTLEFGIRTGQSGKVPLDMMVDYEKYFDERIYQLTEAQDIEVYVKGTYLVDHVFLIHNNGVLLAEESREITDIADTDIFSGMLTAVQSFIKDTFGMEKGIGLKSLEFGGQKLMIERSNNIYLTVTLLGEPSKYITYYMTEVLKEIEDKYKKAFDNWKGQLSELEGVNEIIKKLLTIRMDDPTGVPFMHGTSLGGVVEAAGQGGDRMDAAITQIDRNMGEFEERLNKHGFNDAVAQIPHVQTRAQGSVDFVVSGESQDTLEVEMDTLTDLLKAAHQEDLKIPGLEPLTGKARRSLTGGNYAECAGYITQAKSLMEQNDESVFNVQSKHALSVLREKVDEAKAAGINIEEAEGRLERAIEEIANQPIKMAKKTIEKIEAVVQQALDEGSYLIEHIFLIHNSGILIHELSRKSSEELDGDIFSGMLTAVQSFIKDSFGHTGDVGLKGMELGGQKLLIERGANVYLSITLIGEDSEYLTFYMTEIIREIEDKYGSVLTDWKGDTNKLEGVQEILQRLLDIVQDHDLGIPSMQGSVIGGAIDYAKAHGMEPESLLTEMESVVKAFSDRLGGEGYESVVGYMGNLSKVLETIDVSMLREAIESGKTIGIMERAEGSGAGDGTGSGSGDGDGAGSGSGDGDGTGSGTGDGDGTGSGTGEAGGGDGDGEIGTVSGIVAAGAESDVRSALLKMDEGFSSHLSVFTKLVSYVREAREASNLPPEQKLNKVAIKYMGYSEIGDILKQVQNFLPPQVNAFEVEVVPYDKDWKGLHVEIMPDSEMIRRAYKQSAPKVLAILKVQDPWKVKRQVEGDGLVLGIEGQKITITNEMLAIFIELPPGILRKEFDDAVIYLDTNLSEEAQQVGMADEVISIIKDMRKDMELTDEDKIDIQIFTVDAMVEKLEAHKERIMEGAGAYSLDFPLDNILEGETSYYVAETEFAGEKVLIGIAQVEFSEN